MRAVAVVPFALLLGACSTGGGSSDGLDPAGNLSPQSPQAAAEVPCGWPFVSDPDLLNVAFPDEAATYWVAQFPAVPGSRLRIDGRYPQARYFSFNVYDPLLRPVDALTDYQLLPRVQGGNPYREPGITAGGEYVAYVIPEAAADEPEPNTMYSGSITLPGESTAPLNPTIFLIYRVYLPERDGSGGVPLPQLTFETGDGSTAPLSFSLCEPLPPAALPGVLNPIIRERSLPGSGPLLPGAASAPPRFNRFYNLPESGRVLLSGLLGVEIPPNALTGGGEGGFLSNVDNAYVTGLFTRRGGSLYIVRARAPIFARHPAEAPLGAAQLRYWSLCTNEFATQRFVDCLVDSELPVDRSGYFTLVVSDPDERPVNAVPGNGVGWLPWGAGYPDSLLIYRHMLPSPHFREAIQNIPYGTPPGDVMGEYYPSAAYCDRATIEAAGNDPLLMFRACAG